MKLQDRRYLVVGVVIVAILAWFCAGTMIIIDSLQPQLPTPTIPPTQPPITVIVTMTSTPTAIPTSTAIPPTEAAILPTVIPTQVAVAPTIEAKPDAAESASPGNCTPPSGWSTYTIEEGDTLFGFVLGSKNTLTVDQIMQGNCLQNKFLAIGQVIYLPPGVADESPKVDSSAPLPDGSLPSGPSRTASCPCTIDVRVGWRVEQIAAVVDRTPVGFTGSDFLTTVVPGAPADFAFLSTKPADKSLEGFMFPGSYTLDNNTSAVQFRDMMLNNFAANVSAQVQADAAAHGLTFWQAVTLASIIQKESNTPDDQKLVASVFHNRLKQGKGLSATVTIQYALGVPGNWWPRVRSVNIDSPYNTYLYQGLTPTPISNPSLSAILAAVYPADTNYLYFSAKCGGGGHFFASTFAEFEQGIKCN